MLTNKTEIRNSSVIFGTFGHCILDVPPVQYVYPRKPLFIRETCGGLRKKQRTRVLKHIYRTDQDFCYPRTIGYAPATIMSTIDHSASLSDSGRHTVDALTKAMILHPIACVLAFIAFLLSCGAGVVGSLLGVAVAALAWILALVVMAIDFSIFGVRLFSLPHLLGHLRACFLLL